MPTISIFFGIIIKMNYREHNPPHIHAEYGEFRASYDIATAECIAGMFPANQRHMVQAWIAIHREDLLANWKLSEQREELFRIDPLR
nr:MAG TPA: protein of unknown function (DUF4160) [Caudoviricetes sp.]